MLTAGGSRAGECAHCILVVQRGEHTTKPTAAYMSALGVATTLLANYARNYPKLRSPGIAWGMLLQQITLVEETPVARDTIEDVFENHTTTTSY